MAGFCSLLLLWFFALYMGYSFSTVAFGNMSITESVPKRNSHIGEQPWMKDVVHRGTRDKFRQRRLCRYWYKRESMKEIWHKLVNTGGILPGNCVVHVACYSNIEIHMNGINCNGIHTIRWR